MQLSAGQMLAHYEVLGPLGAGGMGVVYRARDTRLEREVAIKVLPAALVENAEQLARFEREAKLLAALNHPNVATIYGVDHVDGVHFLSLELVPGETLSDRIARGPLPVIEGVKTAQQIAAGLEAAHRTGIVHRDLKPANIVVRPDGTVKILDFGLAKQTGASKSSDQKPVTQAFQVMGTPGYLSPEQARGEDADQRADVWAFGCILFECLVGTRAFPGRTVGECIQAIFETEPDLDALPTATPPTVRLLVSRCLSKDSNSRLRHIGDVKLLLEGALDPTMTTGPIVIERPARPSHHPLLIACLAAAVALVGVLGFLLLRGGEDAAQGIASAPHTLALPDGAELGWRATSTNLSKLGAGSPMLAIAPDGGRVAYCVNTKNKSEIYLHVPGEFDSRAIPKTKNGRGPFFSPDGKRIGFLANDYLQAASADGGGSPDRICSVVSPNFSACWTRDGESIIFSKRTGLSIVTLRGRKPEPLTRLREEDGEVEHSDPAVLDDDHLLFTVSTGTEAHIALLSLETKKWRIVVRNAGSARYAAGRLVYAQAGGIRMLEFDPASPGDLGSSHSVQEGVYATPCSGGGRVITHFDVSPNGSLAYAPATEKPTMSTALWVDRNGEGVGRPIRTGLGNWVHPRLSPDESRFAIDILDDAGRKDVYVYEVDRGAFTQITHDGMSIMSAWDAAGGLSVRSTHKRERLREIARLGGKAVELVRFRETLYADSWSSDTLFGTMKTGKEYSIWSFSRGDEEPKLLPVEKSPRFPRISPDGNWLAYVAEERERLEVFVQPYPALDREGRLSTDGGGEPVWSKVKGRNELSYRRPDGALLVVTFDAEPEFQAHRPRELFTNQYDPEPGGHQHYDVSNDGDLFLMIRNERMTPVRINVVANALPEAAPAR
jgi:serine/threonine-protein kinase